MYNLTPLGFSAFDDFCLLGYPSNHPLVYSRFINIEPLEIIDKQVGKLFLLCFCFDEFSDNTDMEAMGDVNQRLDKQLVFR